MCLLAHKYEYIFSINNSINLYCENDRLASF